MHCQRTRRWLWWRHLALAKFYVKEHYFFTEFSQHVNSTSSGNPGQEVCRTGFGTLTWVPSDKRICIAGGNRLLYGRMAVICQQWNPESDMARRYHRGRVPAQIASFLSNQRTTHSLTAPMTPTSTPGFQ